MRTALSTQAHALAPAFPEWTTVWARMGVWLSLWDEHGQQVLSGGAGTTFWDSLFRHSTTAHDRLRHLAHDKRPREAFIDDLDRTSGAKVVVVPLRQRQQYCGAVLACALTPAFQDEETLARFCDLHGLDRTVFTRLATGLPVVEVDQLQALGRILSHQMQGLHERAYVHSEINDLTTNLAQSYEELNLIYRISSCMNAQVGPAHHLESICHELAAATDFLSVAAVLEPSHDRTSQPKVLRAGPLAATDDELLRLYRLVCNPAEPSSSPRVFNQIRNHAEFAWAGEWLHQFAFYSLTRKQRVFGGVLAINRADGQDLGSCEIQLLSAVADRSAAFLETLWLYDDLEQLFLGTMHALVSSIDAKDPYTCGHSQRVAWLSRYLASLAGLGADKCQRVYLSGLLHDIGKIGVPEAVLRKTGRLTNQEFDEIKRHPAIGARILENVAHVEDIIPGILYHHERLDGRGYPAGLKGAAVPLLGRIIGLADCFDAMTTNRTYRPAQLIEVAAAEIRRCAGTQFDPELAELLLQQDLRRLHAEMTEFSRLPVRAQAGDGWISSVGGRV